VTIIKKSLCEASLLLTIAVCLGLFCALPFSNARAEDGNAGAMASSPLEPLVDSAAPVNEQSDVHGQLTNITQKHSVLTVPYSGPNSLTPDGPIEETSDITLFAGWRMWRGAEIWLNSEIDQGFGFDNTLGIAGFPNGGAYKLGANTPYLRIPRAFIRQVISLGGTEEKLEAAANQLGGTQTADNVTLTVGKFSVPDIFDTNSYAHDPRADFLNWSIIEAGAFDYAADSWGYTFGAAAEWTQNWWTLRGGLFQLSTVPNGKVIGIDFSENSVIVEAEARHQWLGRPGKVKILAFENHGSMGSYRDAVKLGLDTGRTPDVSQVRQVSSRPGMDLNLEQELSPGIGAFARYSINKGNKEAYEFSDINQSLSAGLQLKGELWSRHDDTVGIAAVANRISGAAQAYFAAGGLGILIGDGRLNYAPEQILEMYYSLRLISHVALTLDYQYVANPAYNQDRSPVSIYGVRLHADF
jgi:high affinity Mn2+ porin